ncbi:Crp/Fnr family transcriptional regulator [Candidatus Bipolaricaulota bacterium]|nr:Crp/Fnr family transcriptional regulator [Candidatus Bipolaricaulota bacterium]
MHRYVKSGSLLRRLTLRLLKKTITVKEMTQDRQTTRYISAGWERIFHSYKPLSIHYAPGEMICQAGSYIAGIHLIVQGVVSDVMLTATEGPRDTYILADGDLIGIEILGGGTDRLATSLCRAVTPVELLFVEREQLQTAIDDHPTLQPSLMCYLIDRYVRTRAHPRSRVSVDSQLCYLLLQLGAACGQPSSNGRIALPAEITPRVLGELLCISTRQLRNARQAIEGLQLCESGIEFDYQEMHEKIAPCCPTAT